MQYFGIGAFPTLSQTGLVPADAKSISLAGYAYGLLMNGVNIPLVYVADGRMAANISQFAGQITQLTISGGGYFDDVQFSPVAIPEPGLMALLALGAAIVWRNRRW
jgi:MYXO-CTERM domain-containing protein